MSQTTGLVSERSTDTPVVVIHAHGPATRLRATGWNRSKALVPVLGQPILTRQLRALGTASPSRIVVVVRPVHMREISETIEEAGVGIPVTVMERDPVGALEDLIVTANWVGGPFALLDCDLVAPPKDIASFLSTMTSRPALSGLVVGTTTWPTRTPQTTLWVADRHDGTLVIRRRGAEPTGRRTVGCFWWTQDAIGELRRVADTTDRRLSACLPVLSDLVQVTGVPFQAAKHVNRMEDIPLAAAVLSAVASGE